MSGLGSATFADGPEAVERLARRAGVLLARPAAFLEPAGAAYALRTSPDRRRRPALMLDEPVFRALTRRPGLKPRPAGGWSALSAAPEPPCAAGRPGVLEGERLVADPDGGLVHRRANLGESPLAWLARRRDGQGRPWLDPVEVAAGERLREDHHRAGVVGRLTMDWSGMARSGAGGGRRIEPAEQARAAKARLAAALNAAGPGLREMLERVCLAGVALEAAERSLGLPRRAGKAVLKLALGRLAGHYGIG